MHRWIHDAEGSRNCESDLFPMPVAENAAEVEDKEGVAFESQAVSAADASGLDPTVGGDLDSDLDRDQTVEEKQRRWLEGAPENNTLAALDTES